MTNPSYYENMINLFLNHPATRNHSMTLNKKDLLSKTVEHIDIKQLTGCTNLISMMSKTAFQARNLARATQIYQQMLADKDCMIILCLAVSLISAGMKKIIIDLIEN